MFTKERFDLTERNAKQKDKLYHIFTISNNKRNLAH